MPHPLGFPGWVRDVGSGHPCRHLPLVCARVFELTCVLRASAQRHHTGPLLPPSRLEGSSAGSLGAAQEAGGRALGSRLAVCGKISRSE